MENKLPFKRKKLPIQNSGVTQETSEGQRVFKGFRTDVKDLFKMSEIAALDMKLKHSKLVFIRANGEVECVDSPRRILSEDRDTDVIARWQGQWSSDLFKFKAGDYQDHMK